MTNNELVSYAKSQGFSIFEKEGKLFFEFRNKPNLFFEFFVPKEEFILKNNEALMWEALIKDLEDGKEYHVWAEEYGDIDSSQKFESMRGSYKSFINIIATSEIRIHKHHLLKFFGLKFWERKELQFKSAKGWEHLFL
jgi:hypothetical protein